MSRLNRGLLFRLGLGLALMWCWAMPATAATETVSGEVTAVWGNTFSLRSGERQVLIDAGPQWFHRLDIREGETLRVQGRGENERLEALTITRENGQVLNVRPAEGDAPWAGGPKSAARNSPAATQAQPDILQNALEQISSYGFVSYEEIKLEKDGLVKIKGWVEDGWFADLRVDPAGGQLHKEKRERSIVPPWGMTENRLRDVMKVAQQRLDRVEKIKLKKDGTLELEGPRGAEERLRIELRDNDLSGEPPRPGR